jgi:hypothetical protein
MTCTGKALSRTEYSKRFCPNPDENTEVRDLINEENVRRLEKLLIRMAADLGTSPPKRTYGS